MKRVIFTVLTGNYDLLRDPIKFDKDVDFICFTDNLDLESDVWEIRKCPQEEILNLCLRSRLPKMCPHLFLQDYDISLYIDANVQLKEIPDMVSILGNSKIAVKRHDLRNNIFDEANICIVAGLGKPKELINQIEAYEGSGVDVKNSTLFECSVIFRYHNDPEIVRLGSEWWEHFCKYSSGRDQISFPVVYRKCRIEEFPTTEFNWLLKKNRHVARNLRKER